MQFTFRLNLRRIALGFGLLAAGAAAPLAWATVSGGTKPLRPPAARVVPGASSEAPVPLVTEGRRAPADTGANPYQVAALVENTGEGDGCLPPFLPAGVDFVLEQVTVLANDPISNVHVYTYIKTSSSSFYGVSDLPVDSSGSAATRSFDLVVRPDAFAAVPVGDVYQLVVCYTSSVSGNDVGAIVTGQKISSSPAASSVADFRAQPARHGVRLRWTTGSENELLGFNVWRYRGGKGVQVNRALIRAKHAPRGSVYAFTDPKPGARRGLTYRLQLVDLHGRRSWYSAFAVPA